MNCMIIEINESGFTSRCKDNIIFYKSDLFLPKETLEFIAISYAFKYKEKVKIPFIVMDNVQCINRYKYGNPEPNAKYQKIIDQCVKVRENLNVNAFGLLRVKLNI